MPKVMEYVAIIGLMINLGGLMFGLFMLRSSLSFYEKGQEAIWSEILEIKKSMGLVDGSGGRFVTAERMQAVEEWKEETRRRLDGFSDRLRTVEIQIGEHRS